ncbi:MAG: sigma-54-dependent Fis family transcriptional regulator [Syntrophaceae bacterium]|nr:sigma-54-dependent Fis family transcriptional regulator [Syntrophaceae bacterium]
MANVLIIDDDKWMCDMLFKQVEKMGHVPKYALTLKDGLKEISKENFDVVFLDVGLPDGNGLDVLSRIRENSSSPEVIIITGDGNPDGAELAITNGAWDYIEKPSSVKDLMLPLKRVLQYREEKKPNKPPVVLKRDAIIGSSLQMKRCLELLAQAAGSEANVLITGETGTGKEIFAWAIHDNSPRASNNFVVVDCAALPETLVESVLFGFEKAAFTGADKNKEGLIKQADGGTLLLDEVGELSPSLQKAFLRVLQERRFRPVGSKHEVESNFRLIAATNKDLSEMVRKGKFRSDLLFRLRSLSLELPPLREHPEDIKELVMYHMTKLCESSGIGIQGFAPEFFEALSAYDWPGNVRELFNALEKSLAEARYDHTLFPKHLPSYIRIQIARNLADKQQSTEKIFQESTDRFDMGKLSDVREAAVARLEKEYLQELMEITGGNINKAFQISGLSRPRLYALLKKYHINKS